MRHEAQRSAQRDAQLEVLPNLLTSFFFTTTGDKPFSSGLIHFLAVLGINSDTNRLHTAKNYSYMLAGVVYCMRVLSVEKLLPSACRDKQTDEDRERFLEHREKYLSDGSYSPMSEALSLLAYGKYVALAAGNSGNAYWSKARVQHRAGNEFTQDLEKHKTLLAILGARFLSAYRSRVETSLTESVLITTLSNKKRGLRIVVGESLPVPSLITLLRLCRPLILGKLEMLA